MHLNRNGLLSAVVFFLAISATSGVAQEGTLGDLGIRTRKYDLDGYWMDSNTWQEYGFRPYVKTHIKQFAGLPSYFGGKDDYSYGTETPPVLVSNLDAASSKRRIQLTKYGTWH